MTSKGIIGRVLPALLCVGVAASATAAEPGFYFGLGAGQSSFDEDQQAVDDFVIDVFEAEGLTVLDAESNLDDSDTAFGALAGYRFNPYLAVEAAYMDLGELSYTASGTVTDGFITIPAAVSLSGEASGPVLSVLGILPVSDMWEVYGRAGVFFADVEVPVSVQLDTFSASDSLSASSTDTTLGIGGAVHIGERWSLRLEFQRFMDVGDEEDTGEQDIDVISLGVLLRM